MYIPIFTLAPAASLTPLDVGLRWSAVFDGLTGALIAFGFLRCRSEPPQRPVTA